MSRVGRHSVWISAAAILSGCGAVEEASSIKQIGNTNYQTTSIMLAIDETPNPQDPDAFKLMASSPNGMQDGTVKFCFGALVSCQAGQGIVVSATGQQVGTKMVYISDKYVKVANGLAINILAKNNASQDIAQTYQVKTKGSVTQPTTQPTATQPTTTQPTQNGECFGAPSDLVCQVERAVWQLTNEKRQSQGMQPFGWAPKIGCASRIWSVEQARRGNISHDWFSNGTLRQKYAGECQGTGRLSAENVAMSGGGGSDANSIAQTFVNMWWNSPGHKRNMLGNYQAMGVGFAQSSGGSWYGTQNMGSE